MLRESLDLSLHGCVLSRQLLVRIGVFGQLLRDVVNVLPEELIGAGHLLALLNELVDSLIFLVKCAPHLFIGLLVILGNILKMGVALL